MNRAQRRRAQKMGEFASVKDPVYNMKQSDIKAMRQEAIDFSVETAVVLLLALPIKVLKDHYGWSKQKRLPEFAERLTDEYQAFADGEVSLEEYAQLVYDYAGIKFERRKD